MTPMERVLFPESIELALRQAHPSWNSALRAGLLAVQHSQPNYLPELAQGQFLPTQNRLFAAFSLPIDAINYVLFGEGPYPREESATGVCFMDGAVQSLWQAGTGLSKAVNRATSLRNFIKMMLVAEGHLEPDNTAGGALQPIADLALTSPAKWIQTGADLQSNMLAQGFLLLNASLVFRKEVAPALDAKAWRPFLRVILQALAQQATKPKLILWGKIAEKIVDLPEAQQFEAIASEHPYNLSFITNPAMQTLFAPLHLLKQQHS